jgi:hypothetical protein
MSFHNRHVAPGQNTVDLRNTRAAKDDEELFTHHHDLPTTEASVQEILAGGTPDWVKRPHEFKNFVRESFAREKEISDEMVERYKLDDQEDLTNAKARMVNPMSTDAFIRKLRVNDICPIKCFTVYNGLQGTVGLWCIPPKVTGRARYVCYVRTPAMYEWSLLLLDKHNLPAGELRGWRTVLAELIKNEILTEWQAHQIFGNPSENSCFRRYRQTLWEQRNGKRYTEDELASKEVQM